MANFGSIGFGTLEPGSGNLEEQVCFTGVTQNTNGTATLTGVSNVTFLAPYTRTSGLAKTHAGSTTFIISNTSGFYDRMVSKDDDETITGTYTFTTPNYPQVDNASVLPTLPQQFATLQYVNSVAVSGAPNATTLIKGIVQLPTQVQVDAKTSVGSTGAFLSLTPDKQRSTLLSDYILDTGSPNVIVLTASPAISSYQTGQQFSFKISNSITSPTVSLNINALGAKNVVRGNSSSPVVGDLISGQMIVVQYDGTNFQIQSDVSTTVAPTGTPVTGDTLVYSSSAWTRLAASQSPFVLTSNGVGVAPSWQTPMVASYTNGTFSKAATDASTTQTIAHGLGKIPKFASLRLRTNISSSPGGIFSAETVYNGTTQSSTSIYITGSFSTTIDTTFTLNTAASGTQVGVVTFDATNINIVWTKTGSPSGTYTGIWETYG